MSASVQVAVLAGGRGDRLGGLTRSMPKALVPVRGRPFIDWQLERMRDGGATEVLLCIGHFGEMIEAHIGDGRRFGLDVRFSHDGEHLLGTGGALRHALPMLNEHFVVSYGDSFLSLRPQDLIERLRSNDRPALMSVLPANLVHEVPNCFVESGRVLRYEKAMRDAAMRHVDYGMIGLTRSLVSTWPEHSRFGLEDVLGKLAAQGKLGALEMRERYYEIGSRHGLAELESWLAKSASPKDG